jgi:hypothetical protein
MRKSKYFYPVILTGNNMDQYEDDAFEGEDE